MESVAGIKWNGWSGSSGIRKNVVRSKKQLTENIDIIIIESEKLTKLINDVLDIAKMEAGNVLWQKNTFSISETVERCIEAHADEFEQKRLLLHTEIEPGLPLIIGDRDRLFQVVENILSNALKFTERGSITCRVFLIGNAITVSITDTGIGIAKLESEKVFDRFRQVGDPLTNKPSGPGLGLPICKRIVEQHGGQIWFKSEQGHGSTFSFTVPLTSKAI